MNIKKKTVYFSRVLVFLFMLSSCNKKDNMQRTDVKPGVYWVEEVGFAGPKLYLYENGTGEFVYSPLSSNILIGTYTVQKETLIFMDKETELVYSFDIQGDSLVFSANKSAEIPQYDEEAVQDNMIFTYAKELSEHYTK